MNPDTNKFEPLYDAAYDSPDEEQRKTIQKAITEISEYPGFDNNYPGLIRADGSPVPKHVAVFTVGEEIVIKGYTFKVAYIGETSILFEPIKPFLIIPPKE